VTVHLSLAAFVIALVIGIPCGLISAVFHQRMTDTVIIGFINLGMAVPIFWLAFIMIYIFALRLSWIPVQGYTSPMEDLGLSIRQTILPILLLSLGPIAILARQTRSAMLDVLSQNYIRTARSKGLSERQVIFKHAFKNAIIPVVTVIGLLARSLVGGSVLIETVFNIPGMGRLLVSAIFSRDFAIVQTIIVIVGLTVSIANLAVDLSYGYLNPRIRIGE
jgi:peptide/nickel transport system permease protein